MAIAQAVCNSFKSQVLIGAHNLTTNSIRIALYTSAANLGPDTVAYTNLGEVVGTGYTAGGKVLTGVTVMLDGSVAIVDFADVAWTGATFTARGALIYNATASNAAIAVLDFGTDVTVVAGTFTVVFPVPTASTAAVRLA